MLKTQIRQQERKAATIQTEAERQRVLSLASDAQREANPVSPQLAPETVCRSFWHRLFRCAGAEPP